MMRVGQVNVQLESPLELRFRGGPIILLGLLDERYDDERPVAERGLLADLLPCAPKIGATADARRDGQPARWRRMEIRHVEVGVQDLAERARNRCGGHQQHVRRRAASLGFQLAPLLHTEPVLLVDDDEPEVPELHAGLEQRVRAHDHRCHPVPDRLSGALGTGPAQRASQERHVQPEVRQEVG